MAEAFAETFDAGELARVAGLWHDIGKAHPSFQSYLFDAEGDPDRRRRGPDHKAAGACLAAQNPNLHLLTFVIAGHHGGLPDKAGKLRAFLAEHCGSTRIAETREYATALVNFTQPGDELRPPAFIKTPEQLELFIRMLFSCVVDADHLDTQHHHAPESAEVRSSSQSIDTLWDTFERRYQAFSRQAPDTPVNRLRCEIYDHCVERSADAPGFFRLTVPTGGGKTRAGLAFALRHARQHTLRRVITAVPYTSITEQTADTFRSIFDDPATVMEHHSAFEPSPHDDQSSLDWRDLAAQNWDAPIIVTTTVQLLESLFANRTTRTRKLHNIAGSVILLDEIQSLPPGLLQPTLDMLQQLVEHYHVSVVLSTATQPALEARDGFPGVSGIREIVPDPNRYFASLKRVTFQRAPGSPNWNDIAERMHASRQAMAILNTRKDARSLFEELADPDALHLSTLMCGAHRRAVLAEVRRRIANDEPCRLVSTQLVEAGVDLDFPLVLRAVGPLDRIVQAAGRCNREGNLASGEVVIFDPAEGSMPLRDYRTATDITRALFEQGHDNLHDPDLYHSYFQHYYSSVSLDSKNVTSARRELDFPEVAKRYRIIDEQTYPVIVPWPDDGDHNPAETALRQLQQGYGAPRKAWRTLEQFTVALTEWQLSAAERMGIVIKVRDELWRMTAMGQYDGRLGLSLDRPDAGGLVF